jgi:hypothetical protein
MGPTAHQSFPVPLEYTDLIEGSSLKSYNAMDYSAAKGIGAIYWADRLDETPSTCSTVSPGATSYQRDCCPRVVSPKAMYMMPVMMAALVGMSFDLAHGVESGFSATLMGQPRRRIKDFKSGTCIGAWSSWIC